jgi:hypothetical protein
MASALNSQREAARVMSENTIVTSPSGARTPPEAAAGKVPESFDREPPSLDDEMEQIERRLSELLCEPPTAVIRSEKLCVEDDVIEDSHEPFSPIALSLVIVSCIFMSCCLDHARQRKTHTRTHAHAHARTRTQASTHAHGAKLMKHITIPYQE